MSLLSLIATLGINTTPFQQGLDKAKVQAQKWGTDVGGTLKGKLAGAFAGAAILEGIRRVVDYAGHIKDLSANLDISVQDLQALDAAAEQSGASLESIADAIKKIKINQGKALGGEEGPQKDFKALGISMEQLSNQKAEAIFLGLSAKIRDGSLSAREFAAAIGVMGKTADKLFPAMKEGLADVAVEFERMGLTIDPDTIERLDRFGDRWVTVKAAVKKGTAEMLNPIAESSEIMGGAATNLGLYAEALNDLMSQPLNHINNDYASELIAQAKLNVDTDNDAVLKQQRELQKRLDDKLATERDRKAAADEAKAKDAEDRLKWEEKIKGVRYQMLTDDQKRSYLQKEILAGQQDYWDASKGSADEAKAQYRISEAQSQLKSLKQEDRVGSLRADSFANIGGYLGNAAALNAPVDIARQQLSVQRKIAENTTPGSKSSLTAIFGK